MATSTGAVTNTSGLNFDYLGTTIAGVVQTKETDLRNLIGTLGPNATTADLLGMQQQLQQWTLMTNVQSTVVKELGDALKGIVQKAG